MFRNYLKAALSDLKKNRYLSALNIMGLALGISICMVVITIVGNQLNYDTFHPHANRTYRINTTAVRKNQSTEEYATSPFPLGSYLKDNYPFVEDAVNLTGGLSGEANVNGKTVSINGFFSDKSFFNILGFHLKYGEQVSALATPNSIFLTSGTSEKLFGQNVNPTGRVLRINGLDDFVITGVLAEPAGKTHLDFDAIGSDAMIGRLEKSGKVLPVTNAWANYYSNYTYVLLRDYSARSLIEKSLAGIAKAKYKGTELESLDKGYQFFLQRIDKIIPGPVYSNNLGKALPSEVLWYLSLIGFAVILSAGFNYNSLALAGVLSRTKEIGIRKSFGARKYQLFVQFILQSVLTSLIAMLVAAVLFHFFLRPLFQDMDLFKTSEIVLYENARLYLIFLLFSIVVGVIAGIFPFLYISSLGVLKALKESLDFNIAPKLGFRKVLLIVQFAFAFLFLAGLINIYREINLITHADYGFRKDHIIDIDLQGGDYKTARQLFSTVKGVIAISGSSHSIGTTRDEAIDVRIKKSDDKDRIRDFTVDEFYLDNFRLHLAAGRNFVHDYSDKERQIIVNEAFLKYFHLGSPVESIGKNVILGDNLYLTISGVLKDFNFQPLTKEIKPVLFRYKTAALSQLNLLVDPHDVPQTLSRLSNAWKAFDRSDLFKYSFLADEIQQAYSMFDSAPQLLSIVAVISILVAALGLLGLSTFFLNQRRKEISIRKILGASPAALSILLSRGFILLVARGLLVGMPLTIYLTRLFLKNFVYQVNALWGYLGAIIFLLIILCLTIGRQIFKSAYMNPLKSLRTE